MQHGGIISSQGEPTEHLEAAKLAVLQQLLRQHNLMQRLCRQDHPRCQYKTLTGYDCG
jgi:hypothetical protein